MAQEQQQQQQQQVPQHENVEGAEAPQDPRAANLSNVTTRLYVGNLPWSVTWRELKDHFRPAGNVLHASIFQDASGRSKGCGIVEFETRDEALHAIATLNNTAIGREGRTLFVREDREDRGGPQGARRDRAYDQAAGDDGSAVPRRNYNNGPSYGGQQRGGYGGGGGYGNGGGYGGQRGGGGGYGYSVVTPAAAAATGAAAGGAGAAAYGSGRPDVRGRQLYVGNLPYQTTWPELKEAFAVHGPVTRANILMSNGRSKGAGTVLYERAEDAQRAIAAMNEVEFQGRNMIVHEDKFA